MRRFPIILLVVAGLTMALAVACGDKADGDKIFPPQATTSSGSGSGAASGSAVDLSKAVSAVEDLQSFRFEIAMKLDMSGAASGSGDDAFAGALLGALGDIKVKGAYIRPDQTEVTMTMFGQEMGYVQIGTKAWEKSGGSWTVTTPSDSSFDISSITDMSSDLPTDALKGAKTSKEKVNGVNTTHYAFDKKAMEKLLAEVPNDSGVEFKDISEASLNLWMTDEGIPVRLQMVLNGKDAQGQKMGIRLDMNITDINSSSIKIKPPI